MSSERFIILGGSSIERWVASDEIFKMDRFSAIKWIAGGELKGISQVIAFDLDKGTCRDATEEIAKEVMTRWAHDGEPLSDWQYEFVERHISMNAARSFQREYA